MCFEIIFCVFFVIVLVYRVCNVFVYVLCLFLDVCVCFFFWDGAVLTCVRVSIVHICVFCVFFFGFPREYLFFSFKIIYFKHFSCELD